MTKSFAIAVIGAGPAGLCAARHILLQKNAPRLVIIEKSTDIDKRIPCAEGVGKLGFHEVLEPKESWIRSEISNLTLHSPDNTTVTYTDKNKGYIINRALMQHDLAKACLEMGAEGLFNHTVTGVSGMENGKRTVYLNDGNSISAGIIIDCSGRLSRFGETEANIPVKPLDLEVAYFAHVEGIKTETDTVHLYVGKEIAPGGYAWAFPMNKQSLNIGIVIGSAFRNTYNIRTLLDTFIQKYYSEGTVIRKAAGSIPCYYKRGPIAAAGLIKAGDAISTVNPISRAGICEAMKCGTLAGGFAMQMLHASNEKENKKICALYEKAWHKKMGSRHLKLARVKKFLQKVTDKEYDKGAHALSAIPRDELTMSKIFRTCLRRFPGLILAIRHVM